MTVQKVWYCDTMAAWNHVTRSAEEVARSVKKRLNEADTNAVP